MVFKPKKKVINLEGTEPEEEAEEEEETQEEIKEEPKKEEAKEKTEEPLTINDVLISHETRLKDLESTLFRLRHI